MVEHIRYEDARLRNYNREIEDCQWFRGALYIDQFYSHVEFDADRKEEVGPGTPVIRNIRFRNIFLDTLTGNAVYLTGLPESPLQDITLEHVYAVGRYGLKANNIEGLELRHVTVVSREDEDYHYHNVKEKAVWD